MDLFRIRATLFLLIGTDIFVDVCYIFYTTATYQFSKCSFFCQNQTFTDKYFTTNILPVILLLSSATVYYILMIFFTNLFFSDTGAKLFY